MGRSIEISIGDMTFATQRKALEYFKQMLGRYRDGEVITGDDALMLHQLILRHPDNKVGEGVGHFYKARNPDQPTSGFHLVRVDGTATDFSYITCVKAKKPTASDYLYRACRFAVSPYLTREKQELLSSGPRICLQSGKLLTAENAEYRHTEPSFAQLVAAFVAEANMVVDWSLFPPDRDMQYNVRFLDLSWESSFIAFHKKNAKLALFPKA